MKRLKRPAPRTTRETGPRCRRGSASCERVRRALWLEQQRRRQPSPQQAAKLWARVVAGARLPPGILLRGAEWQAIDRGLHAHIGAGLEAAAGRGAGAATPRAPPTPLLHLERQGPARPLRRVRGQGPADLGRQRRDQLHAHRRLALRVGLGHADAVVGHGQGDAALAAGDQAHRDVAGAAVGEGVLVGVGDQLDRDQADRDGGVEVGGDRVGLAVERHVGVLAEQAGVAAHRIDIGAEVDRGDVLLGVELVVELADRPDAARDVGELRPALAGGALRGQPHHRLHHLEVVLDAVVDLAQQHLLLADQLLQVGGARGDAALERRAHAPLGQQVAAREQDGDDQAEIERAGEQADLAPFLGPAPLHHRDGSAGGDEQRIGADAAPGMDALDAVELRGDAVAQPPGADQGGKERRVRGELPRPVGARDAREHVAVLAQPLDADQHEAAADAVHRLGEDLLEIGRG